MNLTEVAPRRNSVPLATILTFTLVGTLVSTAGTRAAEWVERRFDPPIGSRWIIQSSEVTEDYRDGHLQTSVLTTTSELTIEQKIPDRFRITYVVRKAAYENDAGNAALIGPVTRILENLVVHALTDRNGMPLRITNLREIQATARTAIDYLMAPYASMPEEAAIRRQIATKMLLADDKPAPAVYLTNLATLALGQNTGLRPGETRNDDGAVTSPFGGAQIKSKTSLRIETADPATGTVRYLRTRTFDPDAIKKFLDGMKGFLDRPLDGLAQHLPGADSQHSQSIDGPMKEFTMTLDSRTEIEVEEGISRTLRQEDTATAGTPYRSVVQHTHKLIRVTRAP